MIELNPEGIEKNLEDLIREPRTAFVEFVFAQALLFLLRDRLAPPAEPLVVEQPETACICDHGSYEVGVVNADCPLHAPAPQVEQPEPEHVHDPYTAYDGECDDCQPEPWSPYPIRERSANGEPHPKTSIERRCQTCGASFLGLAAGKTGLRGIWRHDGSWFCSTECAPVVISEGSRVEGYPCPKDGAALVLIEPNLGAWCPQCKTVWREFTEFPAPQVEHEFTENVNDASMCVCGIPALTHDAIVRRSVEPETDR